jgi:ABC-2 type transport system ATP-binding protein
MKQRLGIAQAMLGLPDLLVLDEPTNGLDPPQIAAMRPILRAYADTGRTVVVSSHLLAEVEMTCSHVVVMHAGRVVAAGSVAELVGSADTSVVDLHPSSGAAEVAGRLRDVAGIRQVDVSGDRLVISADLHRADVVSAVVGAGGEIDGVSSRRPLEEVFLGVIAGATGVVVGGSGEGADAGLSGPSASGAGSANGKASLVDRLRQVRSR